jgi:hypothetical protein
MPDFFRTNPNSPDTFIRGAARLMWAGTTIAMPAKLADVINMSLYDAVANWFDLGATKTGIQISVNNAEEAFDVDQVIGDIDARPTTWDYAVTTQLAEFSVTKMQLAWEGGASGTDASPPSGPELDIGFGVPTQYFKRRLAVLFQRSDSKIRGFFFRVAQRTPQESTVNFSKTGEQIAIPMRFKCLPDLSISDLTRRVLVVRDMV